MFTSGQGTLSACLLASGAIGLVLAATAPFPGAAAAPPPGKGKPGNDEPVVCIEGEGGVVEVYRDGALVETRDCIGTALAELVPDPLDGDYELVVGEGIYNEMMPGPRTHGLFIDHHTLNPDTGVQHTLHIRAAEGAEVWLGGPGSELVDERIVITANADRTTIEGLHISNALKGVYIGIHPDSDTSFDDITVLNCDISGTYGGMGGGIVRPGGKTAYRLRIIGNRIHGVKRGVNLLAGNGDPDDYLRVMHNVIYDLVQEDNCHGIGIKANRAGEPVNPDRIEIANNTILCGGVAAIKLIAARVGNKAYMPCHIRIRNNILCADGAGGACIVVDEIEAKNPGPYLEVSDFNNLYALNGAAVGELAGVPAAELLVWQALSGEDGGSISEDPLFADVSSRDVHLMSSTGRWLDGTWVIDAFCSPSIDAGQPDPDGPVDSSGEPEPNGGVANQGAYGGTDHASLSCGW